MVAIKNKITLTELSHQFELNPVMISKVKAEFMENTGAVFEKEITPKDSLDAVEIEKLYDQIGRLKAENDFLKKSCKNLGI